jgi:hypothetical protein
VDEVGEVVLTRLATLTKLASLSERRLEVIEKSLGGLTKAVVDVRERLDRENEIGAELEEDAEDSDDEG